MKSKLITSLAASAGLLITCGSASAATTFDASMGMQPNGFVRDDGVGRNGNNAWEIYTYTVFRVDQILTDTGLSIGDLATAGLNLSFDTAADFSLTTAGDDTIGYFVEYVGFFANADTTAGDFDVTTTTPGVDEGATFWKNALNASSGSVNLATYNSNTIDTFAGQTVTVSGVNLTNVTEANSNDDYVAFRIRYSTQQSGGTLQLLDNYSIGAIPEPSSAALLGLGGLALLLRRRK